MRTLRQITEELYPRACGQSYVPDDIAHEGVFMSISWRMAGALHFCLLGHCSHARFQMKAQTRPECSRRWELWHELSMALIERICKAKHPKTFEDTPLDEYTVFGEDKSRKALAEIRDRAVAGVYNGSVDCHEIIEIAEAALRDSAPLRETKTKG